jgi:His-Xaa-Ser system protein HxsD
VSIELTVDVGLYPVDAVMGTAYVFIDRCYVFLDKTPQGSIRVSLSSKAGGSDEELRVIAGEFQNELLGQALRYRVAARHEKVRETIVARALFGAAPRISDSSMGPEGSQPTPSDAQLGLDAQFVPAEDDDYLEDPLGIAVPWEEKFPNAQKSGVGDAPVSVGAEGKKAPEPAR